jgi:heptosyltransferase-2
MVKFLLIQTAFTGDVVLATALVEKLHSRLPGVQIDFLLRKGNEGLLLHHPHIRNTIVWDKKKNKLSNLFKIALRVRKERYSYIVNVQRFASSGLIAFLSRAEKIAGFDKNPFAFCYSRKVAHVITPAYERPVLHETQRNQQLIADITDSQEAFPRLYPSQEDYRRVTQYQEKPYICIAPSSVWFTKQFPVEKWTALVNLLPAHYKVYVLGGPGDKAIGEELLGRTGNAGVENLCGQLTFLQSAALMQAADMNYTNDSAPLHFASAMNAPVTAVYCSTVPAFGFGPLRNNGRVVEIAERLYCRPCGLHGHKVCPEGHFRCALGITNEQLLWWTLKTT